MKEVLPFLYIYYGMYLYFILSVVTSYIPYRFNKKIQNKNNLFLSIFLDFGYALCVNRMEVDITLKLIATLGWGFCVLNLCHIIIKSVRALFNSSFLMKYRYALGFLAFFIIYFLLHMPKWVDIWTHVWYVSDYSFGIASRFGAGALLNLISPSPITQGTMYLFVASSFFLLAGVVSLCFNSLILKLDATYRQAIIFLMVVYLASPFCVNAYLVPDNFGRLEMHCLLLMLLAVLAFLNIKNKAFKYFTITILSCAAMAVYHGYVFLYYPLLVLVMLLSLLSEEKINKIDLLGCAFNILITGCAFLYFQFLSHVNFATAADFCQALALKAGWNMACEPAEYELFKPFSQAYQGVTLPFLLGRYPREKLYLSSLFLSPFIVYFYFFYLTVWKYKNQKWFYNKYLYCLLAFLSLLPQFLLNIDWGRWLIALGNIAFFEVFILVYFQDKGTLYFLQKSTDLIKKHYLFFLLIIIYLANLGGLSANYFLTDASWLYNRFFLP